MTRQEIMDMPADRELDKLVAERCLKLEVFGSANSAVGDYYSPQINIRGRSEIPFYSTDLAAAWVLAIKYSMDISVRFGATYIQAYEYNGEECNKAGDEVEGEHEEIAMLICKAALLAELGL